MTFGERTGKEEESAGDSRDCVQPLLLLGLHNSGPKQHTGQCQCQGDQEVWVLVPGCTS